MVESVFEEITAEIFTDLKKENIHVPATQRVPNRMNPNTKTIKIAKVEDSLKAANEKQKVLTKNSHKAMS